MSAPLLAQSAGRRRLLRLHLGDRVRHDPGGGRRADDQRLHVLRARLLHQRDPARRDARRRGEEVRVARDHRVRRRRGRDRARDPAGPDVNVAFLVGLAFAVAASANLPVIVLSLFWRRFNTAGAVVRSGDGPGQLASSDHCSARSVRGAERTRSSRWRTPASSASRSASSAAVLGTLLSREPAPRTSSPSCWCAPTPASAPNAQFRTSTSSTMHPGSVAPAQHRMPEGIRPCRRPGVSDQPRVTRRRTALSSWLPTNTFHRREERTSTPGGST